MNDLKRNSEYSRIGGIGTDQWELIRGVFANHPSVVKVTLYGSRAKGNFRLGSDIDMTIEDDGLDFGEYLSILNELDDLLLPYNIDLSLRRQISNPDLLEHIERVGMIVYTRK